MLSRNAAPQKKDRFRSRFIVAVNLLHHLATSASGCSSIKKDCFRSLLFLAGAVGIEPTP